MSERIEESSHTAPAVGAISSEGLSYRDKAMTALKFAVSTLDEATGLLKLYLGLETGAVVVLVKVLTDVHSPILVISALAVSIFLFGLSALICLKLVMGVASVRGKMASTILSADPNWQQTLDSWLKNWQKEVKRAGSWMEWLFRIAILFAGLFVVGFLLTPYSSHRYEVIERSEKGVPNFHEAGTHTEVGYVLFHDGHKIYATCDTTTLSNLDPDATCGFRPLHTYECELQSDSIQKAKMPLSDLKCKDSDGHNVYLYVTKKD